MASMYAKTSTARDILEDKGHHILKVSADTTIYDTLEKMVAHNLGAVLVTEGGQRVGIWTERDLMRDTLGYGFDPHKKTVGECMTRDLKYAEAAETPYDLMDKFLGLRIRHLLIRDDGKVIGLLSIGDVVRFALQARTAELEELKEAVNWKYYEEWCPRRN